MVQAYILIQTEVGKAREVALAIKGLAGVVRVDAVTGPYDVVVLTEARNVDELGKMIVSNVQLVPGITRTLTCSVVHLEWPVRRDGWPPWSRCLSRCSPGPSCSG